MEHTKKNKGIFDDVCSIFFKPGSVVGRSMSIPEALAFYYKVSIIPLVLFVFFGYVFFSSFSWHMPMLQLINIPYLIAIWAILLIWVLVPISIFINAFLYQLIGKNFLRLWNGSYERTFTATMFGEIPAIALIWLMPIPIANIIFILGAMWGFGVLVIGLSEQQKISRIKALGSIAVIAVIIVFVAFAVAAQLMSSLLPAYYGAMPLWHW